MYVASDFKDRFDFRDRSRWGLEPHYDHLIEEAIKFEGELENILDKFIEKFDDIPNNKPDIEDIILLRKELWQKYYNDYGMVASSFLAVVCSMYKQLEERFGWSYKYLQKIDTDAIRSRPPYSIV